MKISQRGIDLIKKYEGFEPNVYLCPAGKKTIGYGHVICQADNIEIPLSQEKGEALLIKDIRIVESFIENSHISRFTQGRFDALCSLVFNWGRANFLKSAGYKFLIKLNYKKAAIEFFSKENGVNKVNGKFSKGLHDRRQAELNLWNGNA